MNESVDLVSWISRLSRRREEEQKKNQEPRRYGELGACTTYEDRKSGLAVARCNAREASCQPITEPAGKYLMQIGARSLSLSLSARRSSHGSRASLRTVARGRRADRSRERKGTRAGVRV